MQQGKVSMEAELQKLTQYIDMVKYFKDAVEGDFCQLRQRSASLAQVRSIHKLYYSDLLPKAFLQTLFELIT